MKLQIYTNAIIFINRRNELHWMWIQHPHTSSLVRQSISFHIQVKVPLITCMIQTASKSIQIFKAIRDSKYWWLNKFQNIIRDYIFFTFYWERTCIVASGWALTTTFASMPLFVDVGNNDYFVDRFSHHPTKCIVQIYHSCKTLVKSTAGCTRRL